MNPYTRLVVFFDIIPAQHAFSICPSLSPYFIMAGLNIQQGFPLKKPVSTAKATSNLNLVPSGRTTGINIDIFHAEPVKSIPPQRRY